MTVSVEVRKRLLYTRYYLMRSRAMQNELGDLGSAIALTLMHDAVEMLMLAVLDHLNINPKKRREFMDFWEEVRGGQQPEPPYKNAMDSLNSLRISLKHKGNLPRPETVRERMASVEAFCSDVTKQYVGIEFETLDLADLVDFPEVKDLLKQSRIHFDAGEKENAFIAVRRAFDTLLKQLHSDVPMLKTNHVRLNWPGTDLSNVLNEIFKSLAAIDQRLNSHLVGIDPIRTAHFYRLTPSITYSLSGTWQAQLWRSYNDVPASEFETCYEFVVQSAIAAATVWSERSASSAQNT